MLKSSSPVIKEKCSLVYYFCIPDVLLKSFLSTWHGSLAPLQRWSQQTRTCFNLDFYLSLSGLSVKIHLHDKWKVAPVIALSVQLRDLVKRKYMGSVTHAEVGVPMSCWTCIDTTVKARGVQWKLIQGFPYFLLKLNIPVSAHKIKKGDRFF